MKKFFLLALLGAGLLAKAQNLKEVQKAVTLAGVTGKYESAKAEVDKLMNDPKAQTNAEAWFYKAKVYAALYKDDQERGKYPNLEITAAEAFQKYKELDPEYKFLKENSGQDIVFNIYATSFAQGVRTFNAKNWDSASFYFTYSVDYSDMIFSNKWSSTTMPFDTTSILYAAYSYQNAKNMDKAYSYYTRLADNKVSGKGFEDIYKFVLVTSSNRKDLASFNKYLAIAKELYPKENWDDYELDYLDRNYTLQEKADLYDKEDAAGTLNAMKYLQFGDIFFNIPKNEKDNLDSAKIEYYKKKARDAFKKAYQKDNKEGIAAYNAGVLYNNEFNDLDDKIRANIKALQELNSQKSDIKDPRKKAAIDAKIKPAVDAIKKANADLDKPVTEAADNTIDWMEKAYNALKEVSDKNAAEKNCFNKSLDILYNLYVYKRDKSKGKDQKAFDEYDAKVKLYDGLISSNK